MTLHPVRMNGLIVGVPQTYSYFDKMQERISRFITENSNISPERLRELMTSTGELMSDVGTMLGGEEAVKEGLINEVGGLQQALSKLEELSK